MEPQNKGEKKNGKFIFGAFLVVLFGVLVAWILSTEVIDKGDSSNDKAAPGVKVTSTEAGVLDPAITYNTAEGTLVDGGINGEGTYHLARNGGGSSKDVALTSSTIDLSLFVGKEVTIWGETLSSKRPGGWLMDIAKVQVKK